VATDLVVQTMAGSAAMLLERLDEAQPAGDAAMGTAMDTTAAQTACHGYLAGRYHRRWACGKLERGGFCGRARRRGGRSRKKSALSSSEITSE